jgi:UDP:flavonoid glycosyltransferase YjiC (YdhE family)
MLEHVTNGGYTGVTMALCHAVPIVQAGVTEEKAEIGARISLSGVGMCLGTSHPTPALLRHAVLRVAYEPSFRRAAAALQRELREHDASREAADRLEQLAATGRAVTAGISAHP